MTPRIRIHGPAVIVGGWSGEGGSKGSDVVEMLSKRVRGVLYGGGGGGGGGGNTRSNSVAIVCGTREI